MQFLPVSVEFGALYIGRSKVKEEPVLGQRFIVPAQQLLEKQPILGLLELRRPTENPLPPRICFRGYVFSHFLGALRVLGV